MPRPAKNGISIYFRCRRISIHRGTIYAIGRPKYIHLLINRKEKKMFIQGCEQDKNAFKIYYTFSKDGNHVDKCHIQSRWFIEYFADMLGVSYTSESLYFPGVVMDDGRTIQIDLNQFETIAYRQEQEDAG